MGPTSVLTKEENKTIIKWILVMQECELPITMQQLKLKVAKITQTRQHHSWMVFQKTLGGNGSIEHILV